MVRLNLDGPAGPLEALLDAPDQSPRAAVLLCHPLPPAGGTMNTHAVHRAMRAFRDRGCAVLRFNFRGVGQSAGSWSEGPGELADGRAALAYLRGAFPAAPTIAGGFSFGSWVGMNAGVEGQAAGLIGLGLPYRSYNFSEVERSALPKALVLADRDEFTSVSAMQLALERFREPRRLWIVEATTHLFTERLGAYEAAVGEAADWLLAAIAEGASAPRPAAAEGR